MNLQISEKLYLRQINSIELVARNRTLEVGLKASYKELDRLEALKEIYKADSFQDSTQQKKMIRMLSDQNDALLTEVRTVREGASMYKARLLEEVNSNVDMKRELQAERKRVSELNYEKVRSCFVYPV